MSDSDPKLAAAERVDPLLPPPPKAKPLPVLLVPVFALRLGKAANDNGEPDGHAD